jgi:carbon-monoxide dehydrogenase medium subunit
VPALIAARAVCRIVGPSGERDVAVEEIASAPGRNTLSAGEFILSFTLPKRPAGSSDAYLRFIPRTEMDIAVVGVGDSLTRDAAGEITAAEVAVGAVAPTALRVTEAGAALVGSKLDDAALAALSAAVEAVCRPISDKRGTAAFRIRTAGVLAARAAKIAFARAGDAA